MNQREPILERSVSLGSRLIIDMAGLALRTEMN